MIRRESFMTISKTARGNRFHMRGFPDTKPKPAESPYDNRCLLCILLFACARLSATFARSNESSRPSALHCMSRGFQSLLRSESCSFPNPHFTVGEVLEI